MMVEVLVVLRWQIFTLVVVPFRRINSSIRTDLQIVSQNWSCSESNRKQQRYLFFLTFSQNGIQTLLLGFCSEFATCCEFLQFLVLSIISTVLYFITFLGKKRGYKALIGHLRLNTEHLSFTWSVWPLMSPDLLSQYKSMTGSRAILNLLVNRLLTCLCFRCFSEAWVNEEWSIYFTFLHHKLLCSHKE